VCSITLALLKTQHPLWDNLTEKKHQKRWASAQVHQVGGPVTSGTAAAVRQQTVSDALLPGGGVRTAAPHADPNVGQSAFPAAQPASQQTLLKPLPAAQPQPVVIRYKNTDVKSLLAHKAQMDLLVWVDSAMNTTGDTAWKRFPMSRSEDNYFAVVELAPGAHKFRFQIGDQTRVDVSQLTAPDPNSSNQQEPCNIVHVSADLMNTKDDDDLIDDGTGWGQVEVAFDETRKYPPMLPPHLRYTPLNTPPTQVRCMNNGSLNVSNASTLLEPEHLPLPLSVTINHVYFQKREDHVVTGITTRYCNKFTTIAYYQGTASSPSQQQPKVLAC